MKMYLLPLSLDNRKLTEQLETYPKIETIYTSPFFLNEARTIATSPSIAIHSIPLLHLHQDKHHPLSWKDIEQKFYFTLTGILNAEGVKNDKTMLLITQPEMLVAMYAHGQQEPSEQSYRNWWVQAQKKCGKLLKIKEHSFPSKEERINHPFYHERSSVTALDRR